MGLRSRWQEFSVCIRSHRPFTLEISANRGLQDGVFLLCFGRGSDDPSDPYWALPKREEYFEAVGWELEHPIIEDRFFSRWSPM